MTLQVDKWQRHDSGNRGTGDISVGVCFIQGENGSHLPLWAQLCGDSICLKSPVQSPVPQDATTPVDSVLTEGIKLE